MAAAVAWLCRSDPSSSACTPQALLEYLVGIAETGEMVAMLQLLLRNQFRMTHTADWRPLLKGHEWHKVQVRGARAFIVWVCCCAHVEPECSPLQANICACCLRATSGTHYTIKAEVYVVVYM